MKVFLSLTVFLICFLLIAKPTLGQEDISVCSQPDDQSQARCDELIASYNQKITNLKNQADTLSGQITYYDNQIILNQLKISQTQELITSITQKISSLEGSLQKRANLLEDQIVATYKISRTDPLQMIITASDFSQIISRFKYTQSVQTDSRRLLHDTQKVQSNYQNQKQLIQDSQKRLSQQKQSLSALRTQKDTLLSQTKNDEVKYQQLLTQANTERSALKAFTQSRGGGLLPPQPSPDGWYYNQRDQRWGMTCIGTTCGFKNPSYVWEVGCLVTSVSMLQKKNGADINPGMLASKSEYFFQDLMLLPWPAQSGYKFTRYSKNFSLIDSELSAGRPVIVEISVKNVPGGRHFLVLKSKQDSGYIMNDPWEGPDLKFSQYYSTASIISVSTYTSI